jgi:hypothetical protein
VTVETALMIPRLVLLAWREMPRRAPVRRWLICQAARACDDNLAHLDGEPS